MDPTEALTHLRTLIRVAQEADDIESVRRLLREMEEIVRKGMTGRP